MFWLNPHTVPTMGEYFRQAGYRTYWQGKWHASAADINVPGTHSAFLTYDPGNGEPVPEYERLYADANVLGEFGFDGWIGPEPFGANSRNSGCSASGGVSGRDVVYRRRVEDLIGELDGERAASGGSRPGPWLVMCSFVNPHDIAIYGEFTRLLPQFRFTVDPSVPFVPPAPTASEPLFSKPAAQMSYRNVYPYALQPLLDTPFYRRLYYSLQLEVDRQICGVLDALMRSSFYEDTVVIFTSDHGELLGAHGGLFQKWYQAYDETIHVPLIIHNPVLFHRRAETGMLTSHVDLLPTMLGLAGLNAAEIQDALRRSHTEVRRLPGRDLTPMIRGEGTFTRFGEPVYFMTDDNITKGINQVSVTGIPYRSVMQPNSVETVIAALPTGRDGESQIWKYSRYFDNPQFQSIPGRREQFAFRGPVARLFNPGCYSEPSEGPASDQYELYNITVDPLEMENLAHPQFAGRDVSRVRMFLDGLLAEQRKKKRLYPRTPFGQQAGPE